MAFPTTPILDSFTETNGLLATVNTNWTALTGLGLTVASNEVECTNSGVTQGNNWNVAKFGPITEVYVTVNTLPASGNGFGLIARSIDLVDQNNVYGLEWDNTGSNQILFYKVVGGTYSSLGNITQALSAGDSLGLLVSGNVLTAYRKTSGSWSTIGSKTDSANSLPNANYIGVYISMDTTCKLTNFGGGTSVTASANWLQEQYWWNNPYRQ